MKKGGDGDPIDVDGTLTISGGTILAGGSQGMEPVHKFVKTIDQEFIYTTDSINVNTEISIKNEDTIIRKFTIPKNINYLFYTSEGTNGNYKFSEVNTFKREDALNSLGNDYDSNNNSNSSSNLFSLKSLNLLVLCLIVLY